MKKSIMLITILIMAAILISVLTKTALADDWSITPQVGVFIPTGSEGIIQDGWVYGINIKYKNAIIKAKRIDLSTRYVGQSSSPLSFNTIMLGFEYDFKPTEFGMFSIGFTGGVALPDHDDSWHSNDPQWEGLLRHTLKQADINTEAYSTGATHFDQYRVEYGISAIIDINMSYIYPIKYGAFYASAGYIYLSTTEDIKGVDSPNLNGGWRIIDQFDCSGATFMIGWKWYF